MTVESVTYITDLNDTYPAGGDAPSEGDNHIRNIKTGLGGTFPNFTGIPMTSTEAELNVLHSSGVSNAQLLALAALTTTEIGYSDGPNTANKFCLLNGSADVPLDQIPDTLTGKSADKHNGLLLQYGTQAGSSTATGATSSYTIALTSITTVYDIRIMTSTATSPLTMGWQVVALDSAGYAIGSDGDGYNVVVPATISHPASGNIKIVFINESGGSITPAFKYVIMGT